MDALKEQGVAQTANTESVKPVRICFVCTGNTCRSPMAEAFTRALAQDALARLPDPLRSIAVPLVAATSAGLYPMEGAPISQGACSALEREGIMPTPDHDYHDHCARLIDPCTVENADLLVGMTHGHAMELLLRFPQAASRIVCMPSEIPDPYGGDEEVYRSCLQAIQKGVYTLLADYFS